MSLICTSCCLQKEARIIFAIKSELWVTYEDQTVYSVVIGIINTNIKFTERGKLFFPL